MKTQPNTMIRLLSSLVIACVMAAFYGQPAAAQTASKLSCKGCVKSKQIKNNGIKGKDMKPGISLGTSSNDGDLSVKNPAGTATVSLDGDTGNVTNSLIGDGVVKAWATINPDGTVAACYRCNTSPAETQALTPTVYEVDFTPLATDIRGRPRIVKEDWLGVTPSSFFNVTHGDQTGALIGTADPSSVIVFIGAQPPGPIVPVSFTVVIY